MALMRSSSIGTPVDDGRVELGNLFLVISCPGALLFLS